MNSLVSQKSTAGTTARYSPPLSPRRFWAHVVSRLSRRAKSLRLRRKGGPSWLTLALLVLLADILLATAAWLAVDFVLN
jgi:hypothetical protein